MEQTNPKKTTASKAALTTAVVTTHLVVAGAVAMGKALGQVAKTVILDDMTGEEAVRHVVGLKNKRK